MANLREVMAESLEKTRRVAYAAGVNDAAMGMPRASALWVPAEFPSFSPSRGWHVAPSERHVVAIAAYCGGYDWAIAQIAAGAVARLGPVWWGDCDCCDTRAALRHPMGLVEGSWICSVCSASGTRSVNQYEGAAYPFYVAAS